MRSFARRILHSFVCKEFCVFVRMQKGIVVFPVGIKPKKAATIYISIQHIS